MIAVDILNCMKREYPELNWNLSLDSVTGCLVVQTYFSDRRFIIIERFKETTNYVVYYTDLSRIRKMKMYCKNQNQLVSAVKRISIKFGIESVKKTFEFHQTSMSL